MSVTIRFFIDFCRFAVVALPFSSASLLRFRLAAQTIRGTSGSSFLGGPLLSIDWVGYRGSDNGLLLAAWLCPKPEVTPRWCRNTLLCEYDRGGRQSFSADSLLLSSRGPQELGELFAKLLPLQPGAVKILCPKGEESVPRGLIRTCRVSVGARIAAASTWRALWITFLWEMFELRAAKHIE
jgi:hypothetical protein